MILFLNSAARCFDLNELELESYWFDMFFRLEEQARRGFFARMLLERVLISSELSFSWPSAKKSHF